MVTIPRRVVVTGGAGFIGTSLATALVGDGYEVVVYDDLSAGVRERVPPEAALVVGTVTDSTALTAASAGACAIVHLAARPRVQDTIDDPLTTHGVNVNGTLTVLEAARAAGVPRVVLASTSAIYGDQSVTVLSEDLEPRPKSPYALHKLIGESYLRLWYELYGMETVSLRFFNVYGPHFDPNGPYALVIGRFLAQKAAGLPLTITGDGTQTRDFVHVTDVVKAIIAALGSPNVGAGEVCNVGSGVATSINELATLIGGPTVSVPPRIEPQHTCADISQTRRLLAWEPTVDLAMGLPAVAQWYQASIGVTRTG
jgi:UDP-glucose 4-epimerase